MESKLFTLGRHLLAEFHDCEPNILNNVELIETVMAKAAEVAGATIVQKTFHHFSPYGVSGVVVIAESHLAIHTWPEHGYAAIDLFTCGESVDPVVSYEYLKEHLRAGTAFYSELKRGFLNQESGQMLKAPFKVAFEHEHLPVGVGGAV
jgi:S-adenosylmethionine decarboxylase proenzyme